MEQLGEIEIIAPCDLGCRLAVARLGMGSGGGGRRRGAQLVDGGDRPDSHED